MLVLAWLFHSQALNPWLASPTRKTNNDITSIAINNGRVKCMHVWQPIGKKFETLSYLPNLDDAQLAKEVEYLLRNGWIPCLEFELEKETVPQSEQLNQLQNQNGFNHL
ncbi:hypothetical protein JHK87_052441 [Glycine soja]|nr:hypothetical protein JHK87_052441 [Glycine soja]